MQSKYTQHSLTEPAELADSSTKQYPQLSLENYKIDYNQCLGTGVYGSVYRVVIRPDNEKGLCSNWFPYLYDYVYRVSAKPNGEESEKYCIKIFKPAIQVLYENSNQPLPLQRPLDSLFEPSKERKTNQVLREKGISEITFFNSPNWYSQLKTRIRGKTLKFYLDDGQFYAPGQFVLRKSFVDFLRVSYKSNLAFCDIHANNLMYDEYRQCWEIIDGSVMEFNTNGSVGLEYNRFHRVISRLAFIENNPNLENLFEIARNNLDYSIEIDQEFVEPSSVLEVRPGL